MRMILSVTGKAAANILKNWTALTRYSADPDLAINITKPSSRYELGQLVVTTGGSSSAKRRCIPACYNERVLRRLLAAGMLACVAWGQALEEGKRAFDAHDYAAAARFFEKASKESPACEIHFYLGLARYGQMLVDPAIIAFQEAIQ